MIHYLLNISKSVNIHTLNQPTPALLFVEAMSHWAKKKQQNEKDFVFVGVIEINYCARHILYAV